MYTWLIKYKYSVHLIKCIIYSCSKCYHINGTISLPPPPPKKKIFIERKMCVLIFPTNFCEAFSF